MEELLKTKDPVTISYVEALLDEAGIHYLLLDGNMSVMEGSLGMLPRRVLVESGALQSARQILGNAGLGVELAPLGRRKGERKRHRTRRHRGRRTADDLRQVPGRKGEITPAQDPPPPQWPRCGDAGGLPSH
ncbi:DUF2007 domain-containing protein [Breoghania sp.]|uniref:putative signal transducing protein n=1 Tax=Breoghania sp. TaxID=2065378 RepID=UPI003204FC14